MIRKTALSAFVALALTSGQFAVAQGNGNRNERGGNDQGRGEDNDRRGNEARQPDRRFSASNPHDNRGFGRAHEQERSKGRGVGPNNEYYRGDRMPVEYRHRNYVVDDWREHRLTAPPRGYQWVQSGADYALIAIATGVIAQVLLGR